MLLKIRFIWTRMRAVIRALLLTAMLWCTFCHASTGHSAVIWMKNGDRLTGIITQQDKDIVFLNLPYSGQVQLPRTQIERIEQEANRMETNLSFFARSKGADQLRLDVQKKVDAAQEKIKGLKARLKLIPNE